MKAILSFVSSAMLAGTALAAGSFVQQLTPDERASAGLDGLSPEQAVALDRLAARYAQEGSKNAVARARAETKAEVEQAVRQHTEAKAGFDDPDDKTVKSKLAGAFKGWSGQTLFPLENGQTWVQADKTDRYWVSPTPGPEVTIKPSGIGGWKLFLPDGRWVRVRRVN